jgi:DNA-binding response OmpR family regulator
MRVLVVDDDEPSCQLLAKVLQRSGMEVDWTIDGLAAYAMALQQHYDLFVFDVRMPLVLGTELAEGLKSTNPQTKVILISSFADAALQETATRLGVTLLSKPFSPDRLLEATVEVLKCA